MIGYATVLLLLVFQLGGTGASTTSREAAEAPLTNDQIVSLSTAGLDDGIIVAKIKEARTVNLQLDCDSLVKLHARHVSPAVTIAMLQRTAAAPATEVPLVNDAVIMLAKAQLSDDVIIAKIYEATAVGFKLDADSLLLLRGANVSNKVIEVMLKATTPHPVDRLAVRELTLSLKTDKGDLRLETHFPLYDVPEGRVTAWAIPAPSAATRIRGKLPFVSILTPVPLQNAEVLFYVVKLLPKEDKRVARFGQLGRSILHTFMPTTGNGPVSPLEKTVVPVTVAHDGPNLWRLIPQTELEPGEYAVAVRGGLMSGIGPSGWTLFDFGVD